VDRDGTYERQLAKLRKDLGEVFLAALEDPETVEIVLNANGTLWQERLGESLEPIGKMSAGCADAAMRTIAAYHHATLTRDDQLPSNASCLSMAPGDMIGEAPGVGVVLVNDEAALVINTGHEGRHREFARRGRLACFKVRIVSSPHKWPLFPEPDQKG
jgi:hypothetical protein